jgi:hypothetical protein
MPFPKEQGMLKSANSTFNSAGFAVSPIPFSSIVKKPYFSLKFQ